MQSAVPKECGHKVYTVLNKETNAVGDPYGVRDMYTINIIQVTTLYKQTEIYGIIQYTQGAYNTRHKIQTLITRHTEIILKLCSENFKNSY